MWVCMFGLTCTNHLPVSERERIVEQLYCVYSNFGSCNVLFQIQIQIQLEREAECAGPREGKSLLDVKVEKEC